MNNLLRRAGFAGLFSLCALSVSAPALAGDDILVNFADNGAVTRTVTVPIADIQLGTASGRAQLDTRIMMAARTACGHESAFGLAQPRDYDRCYAATKSAARAKAASIQTAMR